MAFQKGQAQNESLSKRAVEILRLLAEGLSDRDIADRLIMTVNTVKWYNRQIYSVLGVGSRTQAIARAHELHLIDMGSPIDLPFDNVDGKSQSSLPVETKHFIGRKYELAAIRHLLDTTRLLTLVGPPGTGKTRLALRTAWEVAGAFQEGVYFISLAPISDPNLVTNAIAHTIGVEEAQGQPLIETLKSAVRYRQMLLVLDNFEHLLPAVTLVSELLSTASHVKVVATSREPLHLYGEQEYPVPPLQLPNPENIDPQALIECESTALFRQQAQAVRPDFELTTDNALDVAKICVQLEGLPLAIELAAARIKLLTPRTLLSRLTHRLDILTGGAQDLPARQQTLRNTISWSYNLLDDEEKRLFARVAVFQGGWTLEAFEDVCSDYDPMLVFDTLTSLVDKSLIQQRRSLGDAPRFDMLETLHEYAWEQLKAGEEADTMRRRHSEYFVRLSERAEPEFRRSSFNYWREHLEAEENNLRAALEWLLVGEADIELGLRLVASLRDFWVMSSRFNQAEYWIERALSKIDNVSPSLRVRVLNAAGLVFFYTARGERQKQVLEQAVSFARASDDKINLAWALIFLGSESIGKVSGYEQALALTEEGLSIFRSLEQKSGITQALNIIGELARTHDDDDRARVAYEQCLQLVRETGEARRESMVLSNLGFIALHQGDIEQAHRLCRESLVILLGRAYDRHLIVTNVLTQVVPIAVKGDFNLAARLMGAANAWLDRIGVGVQPGNRTEYEHALAFVGSRLDAGTFDACWNEGRVMSMDEMVTAALEFGNT